MEQDFDSSYVSQIDSGSPWSLLNPLPRLSPAQAPMFMAQEPTNAATFSETKRLPARNTYTNVPNSVLGLLDDYQYYSNPPPEAASSDGDWDMAAQEDQGTSDGSTQPPETVSGAISQTTEFGIQQKSQTFVNLVECTEAPSDQPLPLTGSTIKTDTPKTTMEHASPQSYESDVPKFETFKSRHSDSKKVPIVLIHGDFHTPQIWKRKPDGGKGWAHKLAELGHDVFLVDLNLNPSNFHDAGAQGLSMRSVQDNLTCTSTRPRTDNCAWTMCKLHDKWPGSGKIGDPVFVACYASLRPVYLDKESRQSHAQMTIVKALSKIGKAVLVGEGSGTQGAWLAADAAPSLVFGVIAIEPLGSPFGSPAKHVGGVQEFSRDIGYQAGVREYGLTDIPLTFQPPLTQSNLAADNQCEDSLPPLNIQQAVVSGSYGPRRLWLQSDHKYAINTKTMRCRDHLGVRKLSQLQKVKHVVVTSHTSSHAVYDYATVAFMRQAGLDPVWKHLKKEGFFGNGRLMFLETNSDAIAVKISE